MWASLFFSLSLAAGPAHADDPLGVALVGVELESAGLRETRLELVTEVSRTRWPPVRLRGVEHRFFIGGEVVAEGEAAYQGVRLRPGEPQLSRLPVSVRTLQAAGALGRGVVDRGQIDIELRGAVRCRMLLIPFEVPIDERLVDVDLGL